MVLQPPYKFENFIVATSTLAQVGGFPQKPAWSSFVKIGRTVTSKFWQFQNKNVFFILNVFGL